MIQRIQSIWLFLAAGFDAATFGVPFYTGDWMKDVTPYIIGLTARTTTGLTTVSALTALLAIITIFLYRNRKLQLKLCYAGIFLTALLLTLYFIETRNFYNGSIAIWIILHFAILICFLLAARGILSDEKLIRSMDRLR